MRWQSFHGRPGPNRQGLRTALQDGKFGWSSERLTLVRADSPLLCCGCRFACRWGNCWRKTGHGRRRRPGLALHLTINKARRTHGRSRARRVLWLEDLPTLACYSPARWPVTSLPSVTALSSVAASIKEKAGRFPAGETHSDGSPVLFYFVSARGVGGGVWLIVHTRIFQASPSRT